MLLLMHRLSGGVLLFQFHQVLAHSSFHWRRFRQLLARDSAPLVGVGLDETAVHRQIVPFDQPSFEATRHGLFKQLLEQLGLLEPSVPILRERGVMQDLLIEAQTGEPAPRQMHAQLFDQLALAGNAVQIADQQDAQQKLGVNRRTARLAVAVLQPFAHKGKTDVFFDEPAVFCRASPR